MQTVVGIFRTRTDADRAIPNLWASGIANEEINLLTPASSVEKIQAVPTEDAEPPGVGTALGAVIGGAAGAAGGVSLGTAVASLFVPGVGPVIALGTAALAMVGRAVGGAAAGKAVEEAQAGGLPKDEMFFYEEAFRQGRTVLIVLTNAGRGDTARRVLSQAGAESLDAARENWWVGLRDSEEQAYTVPERNFKTDESIYRAGFEAALRPELRGKSSAEAQAYLRRHYPQIVADLSFKRGYERGQAHHRALTETRTADPTLRKAG